MPRARGAPQDLAHRPRGWIRLPDFAWQGGDEDPRRAAPQCGARGRTGPKRAGAPGVGVPSISWGPAQGTWARAVFSLASAVWSLPVPEEAVPVAGKGWRRGFAGPPASCR